MADSIERIKRHLWHGNTASALEAVDTLAAWLDGWDYDEDGAITIQQGSAAAATMGWYVHDLSTDIDHNSGSIINYGERYRQGTQMSTSFVESTVNYVVSKRMVKNNKCSGHPRGHICCCKCEPRCSMAIGMRPFAGGMRVGLSR